LCRQGRIIEEESSSAEEEGAQQNYMPPYGGIPTPPSYYGGPPMQVWGSGAAMPPQNYVVPNVTFAEPYAQFRQPQQSVAIIGGYDARNIQNIAAIQSNAAQLGEGNANIAYELGRLHLAPSGQFIGGAV
jgi:apolipoprotein N-acyltransferase